MVKATHYFQSRLYSDQQNKDYFKGHTFKWVIRPNLDVVVGPFV